jgi:hypothetical protein
MEGRAAIARAGHGMTHACAIPGCERPAKDRQLMCWPHWRRVPKALNRAIFDTYAHGPRDAYRENVAAAIDMVNAKEGAG